MSLKPLILLLALACAGCGSTYDSSRIRTPEGDLVTERIAGPDGVSHELVGKASWYGERFHGRTTASGEPYDMYGFTAAHKTLPFHTVVRVTEPSTRKSVVVRINDRGPFSEGRVIDLSWAAAKDLDMVSRGVIPIELVVLEWGDDSYVK